jgi:hypothetical protein
VCDITINSAVSGKGAKSTVAACNDPVGTHNSGETLNPLGDQLWVLNEIGGCVDYARNQYLMICHLWLTVAKDDQIIVYGAGSMSNVKPSMPLPI